MRRSTNTPRSEFANLRDRFRIWSQKPFPEFESETRPLFDRLEKARSRALTPPEWCFRRARAKHKAGHYSNDYDENTREKQSCQHSETTT